MQALGNDFAVLVGERPTCSQVQRLADRHYGIGADQVLCVSLAENHSASATFFNADGSQAEMCGNGLRCIGLLLWRLTKRKTHTLQTQTRAHTIEILENQTVRVSMGSVALLPTVSQEQLFGQETLQECHLLVQNYGIVDVGNPHLTLFVRDPNVCLTAARFGPRFETLELFPKRVNVGFAHVTESPPSSLTLAVWERGAGLTKACGSGGLAAAVLTHHFYSLPWPICVVQKGGDITVDEENSNYIQTGPAHFVFDGEIAL